MSIEKKLKGLGRGFMEGRKWGEVIAYHIKDEGLFLINSDGSKNKKISDLYPLFWSEDGKKLFAKNGYHHFSYGALYEINLLTGASKKVLDENVNSPSSFMIGNNIYTTLQVTNIRNVSNIFVKISDGNVQRITENVTSIIPSPDKKYIGISKAEDWITYPNGGGGGNSIPGIIEIDSLEEVLFNQKIGDSYDYKHITNKESRKRNIHGKFIVWLNKKEFICVTAPHRHSIINITNNKRRNYDFGYPFIGGMPHNSDRIKLSPDGKKILMMYISYGGEHFQKESGIYLHNRLKNKLIMPLKTRIKNQIIDSLDVVYWCWDSNRFLIYSNNPGKEIIMGDLNGNKRSIIWGTAAMWQPKPKNLK